MIIYAQILFPLISDLSQYRLGKLTMGAFHKKYERVSINLLSFASAYLKAKEQLKKEQGNEN